MDQNIIGLVLKTGGYPEPVTVSGCHGNQVKFKIFMSKKFLISPPSKNGLQIKFLYPLVSCEQIYEAYGHFNSWKPFVFDRGPIKDNSLFRHLIRNRSLRTAMNYFLTSPLAAINSFLISIFCEPCQSSPFYCLPNFAICLLKGEVRAKSAFFVTKTK